MDTAVPHTDAVAPRPAARPPRGPRLPRRALHGVLLLDKPVGLSSNDALQRVKRLLRAEKAGHTGTLDPLASGLLPLCFGAATKFSQVSLDADKAYRATLRLGRTTTTGDGEGEVLEDRPVAVTRERVEAACGALTGDIDQVPPMHSALKHQGRALYDYARAGQVVERAARRVTIHRLDIVEWQAERLVLDVRCSKGTYVRTLAEDLGRALGCGAHLAGLRRTGSGPLSVDDAVTLQALEAMEEDQRVTWLRPADALVADWPAVPLPADEAGRFLTGLRRKVALADTPAVRVYGPLPTGAPGAVFLGSAHVHQGELIADRLLSPAEVQGLVESLS
ncbi:tRNA pseudouridine(55) synthase TruB [Aquabacterium sp. J223]|uniref:tRNA pseudouridine(55) synthase TruB n=1 Tax=Aquabacterium sp. J223 TaxID=2898431 RepID=UPI0021AE0D49|nr:tRNA pseudouridine(55) synthase TruB [Aquabacterium sp. J223]UUX94781.1 tRNA pseudouridine(55) synthase TruB [Aquabacterium sp. J223]